MTSDVGSAVPSTSFSNPVVFGAGTIGSGGSGFEDELPLLEQLGINSRQIWKKSTSILNPSRVNSKLHQDADLSGPCLFLIAFGVFQLLAGKLHFGILLGWVTVASLFLYVVFNILAGKIGNLDLYQCLSLITYCMLPVMISSASSLVCTRLLVELASCGDEHRGLTAYACCLMYVLFSLLVIFDWEFLLVMIEGS
ncbi:hypothetical protein MKX01_007317 [Papaver californicum]|nr:hypothetical protein MKX01_007317 [Papaver californicum]